jgi:predicted transcriptional regulator of viral defense system
MVRLASKVSRLLNSGVAIRSRDLVEAGLTRSELSRMVEAGKITCIARGLYATPEYEASEHAALVAVAKRAPRVVVCLLTALRLHDLTTQAPFEVWIAIGNKARPPKLDYPPLRVVRYASESLSTGVEMRVIDGTNIRVTNPAKTVADCFKYRNKIGLDVALEALRDAWRTRKIETDELWGYAKVNRVANVMRPYLEALSAE